jgi:hypothetical protein
MDLGSRYSDIKTFLSIPDDQFQLQQKLNNFFDSDDFKTEIVSMINNFIYYFSMFKDVKPFMHSVYKCIINTLDLKIESINDFNELLIKNSIMYFVQDYINYAQLTQKRQILRLLSDSLDKLQVKPLMINLGLLLKPMYQDSEYLNKLNDIEEIEVSYVFNGENQLKIKKSIDNWLRTQPINLDNQERIKILLKEEFDSLTKNYNILKKSETYDKLFNEVMEMLTMRLTVISLTDSFSEESFEPISIR